jgi:3-deoxy-D-manno-octulosonate 8-phosphate phosphatase (KDO 8-P phosphatase)
VARARRVALVVMDVDGVLTDGRMVLSERGDELKAFHTRDGIAVELARRAGLRTAMVTGENSAATTARGTKLGVDAVLVGVRRKGERVEALRRELNLPAEAVAFIGDDLLDLPALQAAGLAIAVADAAPEVKAAAHLVTRAAGGTGVLREAMEFILRAQGTWNTVLAGFVRDHGGVDPVSPGRGSRTPRGRRAR